MRVSNLLRALVITCAAITVALVGAQSADAALSWTAWTRRATRGQTAQCGRRGGGPCYVVNVEMRGDRARDVGHPGSRPGATGAEQYPNGHVECPPSGVWDCVFFFNWPFDQEGNPNNEVVVFQARAALPRLVELSPSTPAATSAASTDEQGATVSSTASWPTSRKPVHGDRQLRRAEPPPPPAALRVHVVKAGTGSGTVTSFPSGINCGTVCQKSLRERPDVTLTATPASGLRLRRLECVWRRRPTTVLPIRCPTTAATRAPGR